MNLFQKLFESSSSAFDEATARRDGPEGCDARIRELQNAEDSARAHLRNGVSPTERASLQAYIEAIACARMELEQFRSEISP
jgi:hypothetical protein